MERTVLAVRDALSLSSEQFARLVGVDRTTVSRWENCTLAPPDWLMDAIERGDWTEWVEKPRAWPRAVEIVWDALAHPEQHAHPRYVLIAVLLAGSATAAEAITAHI